MKKELKLILIISAILILFLVAVIYYFGRNKELIPPIPGLSTTTTTTTTTRYKGRTDKEYGYYADAEDIQKILTSSYSLYGTCQTGKELDLTNGPATASSFTEENIYHMLFGYIDAYQNYVKTTTTSTTYDYKINKAEFEVALESLFGETFAKTFTLKDSFKLYDADFTLKDGVYTGTVNTNGCLTGINPRYYLIRSYLEGDNYIIEYALYYNSVEIEPEFKSKALATKDSTEAVCLENEIAYHLDSFTKYRFTLVREGDNFILDKITQI